MWLIMIMGLFYIMAVRSYLAMVHYITIQRLDFPGLRSITSSEMHLKSKFQVGNTWELWNMSLQSKMAAQGINTD